jgi:Rod binding domain-containing protein
MSETVQALTTAPAPAKGAGATAAPDQLRDAAQEFEAVFLAQLLSQLNPPAAGDGAAGGGDHGLFHDMFNEEMAKLISRSGGIGVADAVLKEMLKLQEVA